MKGREGQLRPLPPWLYGLMMPWVLNQSHLALERKAVVPLCVVVLGPAALYERGRRQLLSPKVSFSKCMAWQGVCGVGGFSQCAGHPSCKAVPCCSLLSALTRLVPFYRELEKGRCLLEGKDTPQSWTEASEGCAVGRAGRYSWIESLLSHLFCTLPPLEEHCLLTIAATSATSFARLQPCLSLLPACVPKGSER